MSARISLASASTTGGEDDFHLLVPTDPGERGARTVYVGSSPNYMRLREGEPVPYGDDGVLSYVEVKGGGKKLTCYDGDGQKVNATRFQDSLPLDSVDATDTFNYRFEPLAALMGAARELGASTYLLVRDRSATDDGPASFKVLERKPYFGRNTSLEVEKVLSHPGGYAVTTADGRDYYFTRSRRAEIAAVADGVGDSVAAGGQTPTINGTPAGQVPLSGPLLERFGFPVSVYNAIVGRLCSP